MNLFLLQFRGELKKLFARKRTYIGFGAFLLTEGILLALLQLPKPKALFRRLIEENGYVFDAYFSGLTLGLRSLEWTALLVGALYLALVAGDVVSKEVEDGTLRMMLCRPVSRLRIVSLKFLSCMSYTFILIFFIGLTALVAGCACYGLGGLFFFSPTEKVFALYEFQEGIVRYLCAIPLLALSLMSITCFGFMFSCFNAKPSSATIATLSVFLIDSIFRNIPYFESLRPFFITEHMASWARIFQPYVPWAQLVENYALLLAIDATFVVIGFAVFERRDFKA